MKSIRAFEIGVRGTPFTTIINSTSAGKAKYRHMLDLDDCYPDLKFTDLTCRSLGKVVQPEDFHRTAVYRGVPFAKVGMAVKVGPYYGNIVGKNSSANFDILFADGPHRGQVLNCHPNWRMTYFDDQMNVLAEFKDDGINQKEAAA